ncbi:HAMP domain-containing sensor histidine kinase [Sporolactobacillus sp. Y61]|jgi:signal transduction histidine kinase|uniref:histidine kinase n=1 Tax=Sporolactobacillus sp. Y61 TaxID=3160863 RepID=A0AAU8IDS5_9BACL|nr:HAMP domain-containing sensor histidine kinase [Sporolactobacillus sp. THM19-2]RYL93162.1 two-component sensor histidine kinase [Sporolactobacillus sp. THM19-2]
MKYIRIFIFICTLLTILSIFWGGFYFFIGWIAVTYDVSLHPLFHHIVSSILGISLFSALCILIGYILRPRKLNYFQAMIQAMQQMAKGNFEIHLDLPDFIPGPPSKNNPFIQLADNMHYMARELGQLERLRQEFISNISHEVQSPLTSIKGFARALENNNLTAEKSHHYLNIILTESDRLSKLSDNLLKLTSLESGRHPVTMKPYRVDRQIRSALLPFEPQWTEKKIHMNIQLHPVTITADGDLLGQVWTNLIQNSLKFTHVDGHISIHLFQKKNMTVFCISDDGIGIREEERLHLFERFYKADRSRNREAGGNGLGLSIVKKIVDVHHGKIDVKSTFGKGTTVTVRFFKMGTDEAGLP